MGVSLAALLTAGGALAASPVPGVAQEDVLPAPALVLSGGAFDLDADSADAGTFVALRLDLPLADWAVLDGGLERATYDDAGEAEERFGLEFSVRAEWPRGRIRPYLGPSLGAWFDLDGDRPTTDDFVRATYGGVGGLRVLIASRFDVRAEARLRWFDGLDERSTLFGAGLAYWF